MKTTLKALGTGILLAQMVFSLVTFNVAFATDYYVDPENGNNAWDGTTPVPGAPDGPKSNVYDGPGGDVSALEIPTLAGGDVINLLPGIYDVFGGEVFPYDFGDFQGAGGPVLPDGLIIRGHGDATTVEANSGLGAFLFGSAAGGGTWSAITRLEDMEVTNIVGPGVALLPRDGDVLGPTIDACTIRDCGGPGVFAGGTYVSTTPAVIAPVVDGCTIAGNDEAGIQIDNYFGALTTGGVIAPTIQGNTVIEQNDGAGIDLSAILLSTFSATVSNTTIRDNNGEGIRGGLFGVFGTTFTASLNVATCDIVGNDGDGIWTEISLGLVSTTVAGCTIAGNDGHGIRAEAPALPALQLFNFSGNTIEDNASDGIALEGRLIGVLGGTIGGNTVRGNGNDGISAQAGLYGLIIVGLSGNTIVFNEGDGIHMEANGGIAGASADGNAIQANGGHGVSLDDHGGTGLCSIDLGGGPFSSGGNWISDNYSASLGFYEVAAFTSYPNIPVMTAMNNYWGVSQAAFVEELVFDGTDQAGNSIVDDSSFLNSVTSVVPVSGWNKAYLQAAGTDAVPSLWWGMVYDTAGDLATSWSGAAIPADGVLSTWHDILGGNLYADAIPAGVWNVIEGNADLFAGMWRSNGTYGAEGWAFTAPTSFRAKGTEFVIPMSGWSMSKVFVASAKTPGVTSGAVEIYDADGIKRYTESFSLPGFGAVWKSGDLYDYAKPAVVRVTADRDVTVATGQYKLGSAGGWGSEVYPLDHPLTPAKGTSFVFPANGWSKCWFEVANVSGGAVANGTLRVYDAGGTVQGVIPFTIPNPYGYWRSDPDAVYHVNPPLLTKPAVVLITTAAGEDVVVRHARYTTDGGGAGWGYSVLPVGSQQGTIFEFPVRGWSRDYVEIVAAPGAALQGNLDIFDGGGALQQSVAFGPLASYGYVRSTELLSSVDPSKPDIYDWAKPAKVTVTATSGSAIVTSNCWTSTLPAKTGWSMGILPNDPLPTTTTTSTTTTTTTTTTTSTTTTTTTTTSSTTTTI